MIASDSLNSIQPAVRASSSIAGARSALMLAAQIGFLWLINLGASTVAAWLHAPVPGNVVGLTVLFVLLSSGLVKASWLEPAATLLVKHLAFFFIPITVGLMDMGQLFALHGVGILFILATSAAVGMAVSGVVSTRLMNAQGAAQTRCESESGA
jgi:holin-like protein